MERGAVSKKNWEVPGLLNLLQPPFGIPFCAGEPIRLVQPYVHRGHMPHHRVRER